MCVCVCMIALLFFGYLPNFAIYEVTYSTLIAISLYVDRYYFMRTSALIDLKSDHIHQMY